LEEKEISIKFEKEQVTFLETQVKTLQDTLKGLRIDIERVQSEKAETVEKIENLKK
jgi:hypothetical protein